MTFIETLTLIKDVMSEYVWSWPANWWPNTIPLLVLVLLGTGIFVSFRYGFIQFRRFAHGWKVIRGDYDNPDDAGDINHFQALSAALSATIGIGNIAGVATAIHYGGTGASSTSGATGRFCPINSCIWSCFSWAEFSAWNLSGAWVTWPSGLWLSQT